MDFAEQVLESRRKIAEADNEVERLNWSVNLRGLLLQRGQRPCEGSIFCDEAPRQKCAAGKHDTCAKHGNLCASCRR